MPARKPDYISYDKYGDISSMYWYYKRWVIRWSTHWSAVFAKKTNAVALPLECGNVSSCFWTLKVPREDTLETAMCGKCNWNNFSER